MSRRRGVVATIVALAVTVGGCASASSSPDPNAAHPALARQLQHQLLTASELGSGWQVDHSKSNDSSQPGCARRAQAALRGAKANQLAKAERSFTIPGKAVTLTQQLARFKTVQGVLTAVRKVFDSCKELSVRSGGQTLRFHVRPAPFPSVGEPVIAYRMTTTMNVEGQHVSGSGFIVAGTSATTLVTVFVFRVPPVDAEAVAPVVQLALQNAA